MFTFEITASIPDTLGRSGFFTTPHHKLETPELAIVATEAEIKSLPKKLWAQLPCQYLIVNTFHINSKKDPEGEHLLKRVEDNGKVHSYMELPDRTIASDSGGFQVFSLGFGKSHHVGKIGGMFPGMHIEGEDTDNPLTITSEGVSFPFDGGMIELTPEKSMDIQHRIGADIMFAFDECTSPLNSKAYTEEAQMRTYAWLDRCITQHKPYSENQALFAIIQGGAYEDLRIECAQIMAKKDVPGYGIGGSLGKTKEDMYHILEWTIPHLPVEKPRHLLGIGSVKDIFEGVERGVDLFDCVIPTREGRHGRLYTKKGSIGLRKMKTFNEVIDSSCQCFACREGVTYVHLWELYLKRDPQFLLYMTAHNIWFFSDLMKEIRDSIHHKSFSELKTKYLAMYS